MRTVADEKEAQRLADEKGQKSYDKLGSDGTEPTKKEKAVKRAAVRAGMIPADATDEELEAFAAFLNDEGE